MKKIFFVFSFVLLLGLMACSSGSLESYEEVLAEAGWDIYLMDSEDFDDDNAPDGILHVLEAEKGLWEYGYIYQFNSSSNARSFFNELKDEFDEESGGEVDIDDYIKNSGNFVFFSFTESFYEDLDMD